MNNPRSLQDIFEHRCQTDWLIGLSAAAWEAKTRTYLDVLAPLIAENIYPRILLTQADPAAFLGGFMAAAIAQCPVLLGNPTWSASEWETVAALTHPHLCWGERPPSIDMDPITTATPQEKGWILIPTSGTSSSIKFAIHTWETLSCAVYGFCLHFFGGSAPVNSCCCLPLYHVSGLMQFMRSFLTGGVFAYFASNAVLTGQSENLAELAFLSSPSTSLSRFFLSLVPTQLWRLLQSSARIHWLQQFSAILVGGGATSPELLRQAREARLNLAPTYGMTEMAAQVATLRPDEFLQGQDGVGYPLPHTEISILNGEKIPLPLEQIGQITILSSASFLGYYPEPQESVWYFPTGDRGYFDAEGFLHVLGRSDRQLITGGENVSPEEVEAAVQGTGLVQDVYVVGIPDPEWGQAIAAFYVPIAPTLAEKALKTAIAQHLSAHKHPKHWQAVQQIPRNAQGKVILDSNILQREGG
jgi:O-succinylbenzoic acid--CoA ligase